MVSQVVGGIHPATSHAHFRLPDGGSHEPGVDEELLTAGLEGLQSKQL